MDRDTHRSASALDGPLARLGAAGVLVLVALLLGYVHRDDLFPPEGAAVAADDPVARCFAQRAADIDQMLAEDTIRPAQAELFKDRARALCQAQAGQAAPR